MTSRLPPIARGYPFAFFLRAKDGAPDARRPFPLGVTLASSIVRFASAPSAIVRLSTETGGIVRLDDDRVQISLSALETGALPVGRVVMDLVRTDVDPVEWMALQIPLAVINPITSP